MNPMKTTAVEIRGKTWAGRWLVHAQQWGGTLVAAHGPSGAGVGFSNTNRRRRTVAEPNSRPPLRPPLRPPTQAGSGEGKKGGRVEPPWPMVAPWRWPNPTPGFPPPPLPSQCIMGVGMAREWLGNGSEMARKWSAGKGRGKRGSGTARNRPVAYDAPSGAQWERYFESRAKRSWARDNDAT